MVRYITLSCANVYQSGCTYTYNTNNNPNFINQKVRQEIKTTKKIIEQNTKQIKTWKKDSNKTNNKSKIEKIES